MTKDEAFARLGKSKFRSRFRLTAEDLAYIDRVGLATIWRHAEDFVLPEAIQSRQISWELHFVFRDSRNRLLVKDVFRLPM